MSTKTAGFFASLFFAIAVVAGYFWLWQTSKNFNDDTEVAENLKSVEIESVKKDAENVLSGLQKNSDIPVSLPVDKMGKENPFVTK